MLNIAICDDESSIVSQLKVLVTNYFSSTENKYTISCFTSPEFFLQGNLDIYDIVFLDVQMGDIDGLQVAEKLREINPTAILIFVSQYNDYTTQGYHVKAFRYILKSTLADFFKKDMDSTVAELNKKTKKFFFKMYSEGMSIPYDDILYFQSIASKIEIVSFFPRAKPYTFTKKLDEIELELKDSHFVRIQQSMLVNVKYITSISSYKVYLINGEVLSASRLLYPKLRVKYAKIKRSL